MVAAGTTTLRALESAALAAQAPGSLQPGARETSIFITPGFRFRVVDLLVTNFHLPKSTLLMLVSALAGHDHVRALYRHAIESRYRFFSYGDAMLLQLAPGSRRAWPPLTGCWPRPWPLRAPRCASTAQRGLPVVAGVRPVCASLANSPARLSLINGAVLLRCTMVLSQAPVPSAGVTLKENTMTHPLLIAIATLGLAAGAAQAADGDAMLKLATNAGCMTCHHIEPGAKGPDGLAPIGPAWRDVATKYQGQQGAAAKLTQTVLAGSNPYQSHWKGKVSGLAMPPNAVAIKEADARKLVQWILALNNGKKP